jgi:hypothetical protein
LEKALLTLPWQAMCEGLGVKLLPQDQELYVLAQSHARIHMERASAGAGSNGCGRASSKSRPALRASFGCRDRKTRSRLLCREGVRVSRRGIERLDYARL